MKYSIDDLVIDNKGNLNFEISLGGIHLAEVVGDELHKPFTVAGNGKIKSDRSIMRTPIKFLKEKEYLLTQDDLIDHRDMLDVITLYSIKRNLSFVELLDKNKFIGVHDCTELFGLGVKVLLEIHKNNLCTVTVGELKFLERIQTVQRFIRNLYCVSEDLVDYKEIDKLDLTLSENKRVRYSVSNTDYSARVFAVCNGFNIADIGIYKIGNERPSYQTISNYMVTYPGKYVPYNLPDVCAFFYDMAKYITDINLPNVYNLGFGTVVKFIDEDRTMFGYVMDNGKLNAILVETREAMEIFKESNMGVIIKNIDKLKGYFDYINFNTINDFIGYTGDRNGL